MHRYFPIFLAALALACPVSLPNVLDAEEPALDKISEPQEPAAGKQVAQRATLTLTTDGQTREVEVPYLLFLPSNYDAKSKLPLMIFLHGSGERGPGNLDLVKVHGPPKLVAAQADFPFITISPQCPKGERWDPAQVVALVEQVAERYGADRNRFYITGLSMGGYGTWATTAAYPKLFAAAVPICGGGTPEMADALVDLPIWVFHGAKDSAVSLEKSEKMVEAIKSAGGKQIELTIYPEAGHDSWTQTYNNPELYTWLLKQRRNTK